MSAGFNDAGKSGLANGVSVTSSNTGNSGNLQLTPNGTAPVKRIDFTLPQVLSDVGWYETSTAGNATSYLTMVPAGYVAGTGGAVGAWVMVSGFPNSNMQLMRWGNSGANYVGLTSAGKLFLVVNGSVVFTCTNAVPTNTPFWISHSGTSAASGGISRLGWWDKAGVLKETFSKTDGVTNAITAGNCSVGRISSGTQMQAIRIASIRGNNDGNALIPPVIPMGSRGWIGSTAFIASPNVVVIPDSIDYSDSTDVTSDINSWLASLSANTIAKFRVNGSYRVEGSLLLPNRSDLTIDAQGSTFHCHAAPTESQPMWKITESTRIVLKNGIMTASYASPGTYSAAVEHAHGVALLGCNGSGVENFTLNNFGGDGIYYGLSETGEIRCVECYDAHVSVLGTGRNGVSVVAGDYINSHYLTVNTIGLYGFDVEPNTTSGFTVAHVVVDHATFHTCRSYTFAIVENNTITDVTLRDSTCDDTNGFKVIVLQILANPIVRPSNVRIIGNSCPTQYSNPRTFSFAHVDGLQVTGNNIPMWCSQNPTYMAEVNDCTSYDVSGNDISVYAGTYTPPLEVLVS